MPPENLKNLPSPPQSNNPIFNPPHADAAPIVAGSLYGGPHYAVWRTRGTRDWLLLFTRDGEGRIGHVQGEIQATPGDIVLLRPGTAHDYGTARGTRSWTILWAHFLPLPHWLDWLGWPEPAPGILRLRLVNEIREQVEASLETMNRYANGAELPQRSRRRHDFARHALEEALLWCDGACPDANPLDERVARTIAYLRANLPEPVALPDVARHAGLSVSRLAHLFKTQTGMTPMQYLESERLLRARQLLWLTGRPIGAIAAEVGFENPIHFSLRFKKRVGISPRAYRLRRTDA